jgi:signal transduction histidine kinase
MTLLSRFAKDRVADASMRLRIWQLAIFACMTLAVLGALLARSVERSREANGWVDHTHIVLDMIAGYTGDIVNAEASQRGYLLTQQDSYLVPFQRVLATNQAHLAQLKLVITNGDEPRKLVRLSQIFHDKLSELSLTIALARSGNLPAALGIVRDGRGQRYMVEFRRLGAEIAASEYVLLRKRQADVAFENSLVQVAILAGGALAIVLILLGASRTVELIEDRARRLLDGILAVADGRLSERVEPGTREDIGKIAQAFNAMAGRLLDARLAREAVEADLAASNSELKSEVDERTTAQGRLFRSVAELKRSNEELDNFAYGASHDLKAPLRGIRNLAQWIADDVKDKASADTLENLALLHNRVDRLDMLLDSLLQYSRVGRTGGAPEDIDIARLVGEIADYLAPQPGFQVICRGEFPVIHTNKAPLEQVLRNLIGNGLKHHGGDGGTVTVSAREFGDMVEFRVEDDGPGIPPEFHARIFQMFQTLKSRDELEGSGMGLAIVKKSVEVHGGTVRVESAPPLRGTAFVFTWHNGQQALAA